MQHQQHAAAVTRLAVARLLVDEAPRRADEEHQPALDATMPPVHGGAMAKRRRMRRAVRAGHRKIVVVRRALVRVETIRAVATAAQATAHRVRAHPAVTLARPVRPVPRAHPAPEVAKVTAARHLLVAAAAMVATAVAATTVAIAAAEPVRVAVVDRAMAVGAALAATAVKVTARRARAGASVVNLHRAAASAAAAPAAVLVAALAMTVAHLLRALLTLAVTTRADQTVRREPAAEAAVAGAIAMA